MYPIGIQLYTVRDECNKDILTALKKVKDIGFKGVELGGFYNMKPRELAIMIKDLGLEIISSHIPNTLLDTPEIIIEEQKIIGNNKVVTGFGPGDFSSEYNCKRIAEKLQQVQESLCPSGIRLGYHNHDCEFKEFSGRTVYDILFENTKDIFFQVDVYWVRYGRHDPTRVIRKVKNRVPLLHIKDGKINNPPEWTAVGDGMVDVKSAIKSADSNILEWLIIEIDVYNGDIFEAVKKSYNYLVSTGLGYGNK